MPDRKIQISKDFTINSVLITKWFDATVQDVWRAFTEKEILAQWWAPLPWKVETKHLEFAEGGHWLYAMVGPAGEKHWAKMDYIEIDFHEGFQIVDSFCDENGVVNPTLPISKGEINFSASKDGTLVEFQMTYDSEKELNNIIEMGFEAGITMTLEHLDSLFKKRKE